MKKNKIKLNPTAIFSVCLFFVLWEILGRFELINPIFISYPTKILLVGKSLILSGDLWPHLKASLLSLFFGFSAAIFSGLIIGLFAGYNKSVFNFLKPYIFALNSLPKIALIPLIIIWFGIGIWSKIVVIFIMALPSITISVIEGVKNAEKELVEMVSSFGGSKFDILRSVIYFESLPYFFSGLKIATGKSIIGLVISELFGYGVGLGYLLSYYGATFKVADLMFIILLLLLISLILNLIIDYFSKIMLYWKRY